MSETQNFIWNRDRTKELLQQLNSQNRKVRYVNNYYPNGFGFAVRCGLENFQGDAVVIVMADSSDAPENIVDYYYKLQEGYDCVFGSRFMRGGKVIILSLTLALQSRNITGIIRLMRF